MTAEQIHSLSVGWRNFFSSCAVVSVFGSGGKQVLVLHTYILRVQYSCGVVLVFQFWREIVFGVTYVLSVQDSCAVLSVFWLWWEIVLKMRTPFEFLFGYFIMTLFYSISLSQPLLMDGMTDRGTNTLAARGLEELFFQLCCCVSFWFWPGNRFWFYILMYLEYNTIMIRQPMCVFHKT